VFLPGDKLKTIRAEAWQNGFQQAEQQARETSEATHESALSALTQALEQCEFTHVEARRDVLKSLQPLLEAVVRVVLPEVAAASIGQIIVEEIMAFAKQTTSDRIQITCATEMVSSLHKLVAEAGLIAGRTDVVGSPDCPTLAARIAGGEASVDIDLDQALKTVTESLSGFFESQKKVLNHG